MGAHEQTQLNELTMSERTVPAILYTLIDGHISDSIYVMKVQSGPVFRYAFANRAALSSIGKSQSEVIGQSLQDVLPDLQASSIQQAYEQALARKEEFRYTDQVMIRRRPVFYETQLTPIIEQDESVQYIFAVCRDVTETTGKTKELKKVQERASSLFHFNLDPIFTLTSDGEILSGNMAVKHALGIHLDTQSPALPIRRFIHPSSLPLVRDRMKTVKETGKPSELKSISFLYGGNQQVLVQLKLIPIKLNEQIDGMYMIVRDITEQKETKDQINFLAMHDRLTGLLNRHAFNEQFSMLTSLPASIADGVSVIYLDLDRFKVINESLGYNIGDELLKMVAQRLSGYTNSTRQLYRLNADEFVFLYQEKHEKKIESLLNQLIIAFQEPFYIQGKEIVISSSIGVSIFPDQGLDVDTLVSRASQALYTSKRKRRGHYLLYSNALDEASVNEVEMENHLRRSIEKNELTLVYQPQVDLLTNRIESVEALLRWTNPKFGFVSPAQFIPLAERTGLILPIGTWVIEQACIQLSCWRDRGMRTLRIAVNISPLQFVQENFDQIIQDAIAKYNLQPEWLEIEITEGAMGDLVETLAMLKKLKKIGVIISVDDFGTGYSSLNYLKRLPIDILKIDQSFVKELQQDEKDAAITKTIIHLAHSLDMEVVAEGVELESQVNFLRRERCQKAQGYFFSKPITSREMEHYVKASGL